MRRREALMAFVFLFLISFPSQMLGKETKIDYSKITLDSSTFNPASVCGECHVDIYVLWKTSMHAKAFTDPAFQDTFMEQEIQRDDLLQKRCLQCHVPTVHYNPNVNLQSEIAREGVTCDFCHSIQGLDLRNVAKPFVVKWGKLKRGPYEESRSSVHETQGSSLFESGDLCGGCHDMTNFQNLPVITTYSEWKNQYYDKVGDSTCQNCHMPLGAGVTVTPAYKETRRRINLHNFPGGHSRVQLLDALEMNLLGASREYGKMNIKLGLTNEGAGHYIPTGNPLRKIIVEFSAYGAMDEPLYKKQVELSKKFVDKNGKQLSTDLDILLNAAGVSDDSRIPPGATRELTFNFAAPNEKILIEARVIYAYENTAFPKMNRREELLTFTKVVNK